MIQVLAWVSTFRIRRPLEVISAEFPMNFQKSSGFPINAASRGCLRPLNFCLEDLTLTKQSMLEYLSTNGAFNSELRLVRTSEMSSLPRVRAL